VSIVVAVRVLAVQHAAACQFCLESRIIRVEPGSRCVAQRRLLDDGRRHHGAGSDDQYQRERQDTDAASDGDDGSGEHQQQRSGQRSRAP
jgi:hypothetical protein